jgi:hypothetical protein
VSDIRLVLPAAGSGKQHKCSACKTARYAWLPQLLSSSVPAINT